VISTGLGGSYGVQVMIPGTRASSMLPPPSALTHHPQAQLTFSSTPLLSAQGYTSNHAYYQADRDAALKRSLQDSHGHYIMLRVDLAQKRSMSKRLQTIQVYLSLNSVILALTLLKLKSGNPWTTSLRISAMNPYGQKFMT
jgi:hypothetical protein